MTFLFDIGRVLLDFDFDSSLARLLPPDCKNPQERLARMLERKDDFEAGNIEPEDYTRWALDVLGSDATPDQFCHAWCHIFTPNEPMWECVRKLSMAGHRLILFSNTNAIHCPWVFEEFRDFALFDDAVLSFIIGSIKPHPPIYQRAVDELELTPSSTFYIDDMPQNIATGMAFGFHCHLYDLNNHTAFEEWLASYAI